MFAKNASKKISRLKCADSATHKQTAINQYGGSIWFHTMN
jgi:hypothetical protein